MNEQSVILFDGVCIICTGSVQFILKRDKEKKFRFALLQSKYRQDLLKQFDLSANTNISFILLKDGTIFTKLI